MEIPGVLQRNVRGWEKVVRKMAKCEKSGENCKARHASIKNCIMSHAESTYAKIPDRWNISALR